MEQRKSIAKVVVHYRDGSTHTLSQSEFREHFPGHFLYRKSQKVQRIQAATKPRALTVANVESIKAEYAARVQAGKKYGALADLSRRYGVSVQHLRTLVTPRPDITDDD